MLERQRVKISPYQRETERLISEMAKISGLDPKEVVLGEVRVLRDFLTFETPDCDLDSPKYEEVILPVFDKYFADGLRSSRDKNYLRGRLAVCSIIPERRHKLTQLAEAILDIPPSVCTYGLFLPFYLRALLNYKEESSQDQPHRALLVGALAVNTINEFKSTARSVFPNAKINVIDLSGSETCRVKGFCFANGLHLPFSESSFDTIHTNMLFHSKSFIRGGGSLQKARKAFFDESVKCLKPGGRLILVEGVFNDSENGEDEVSMLKTGNYICQEAIEAGFGRASFAPAPTFSSWRYMYRFLGGNPLAMGEENITFTPEILGFSIVK